MYLSLFSVLCLMSMPDSPLQAKMATSYKVATSTMFLSSVVGALGWLYKNNVQKKCVMLEQELKGLRLAKAQVVTPEESCRIESRLTQVQNKLAQYKDTQKWIKRALMGIGIVGGLSTISTIAHNMSTSKKLSSWRGAIAFEKVLNNKLKEFFENVGGVSNNTLAIHDPLNSGEKGREYWQFILSDSNGIFKGDFNFQLYGKCEYEKEGQKISYDTEVEEPETRYASDTVGNPGKSLHNVICNPSLGEEGVSESLVAFGEALKENPDTLIKEAMEHVKDEIKSLPFRKWIKNVFLGRYAVDESQLYKSRDAFFSALERR